LRAGLDRAVDQVRAGQGELAVTATRRGIEASLGYKPKSWLSVGGYAGRLWGGGWDAGARATVTWGKR
jgi:hypothetical protein